MHRGAVQAHPKGLSENTGDLQWKMRTVCNASPCAGERKVAGAGAMGNNEKNNEKSNERAMKTGGDPAGCPRPVVGGKLMGGSWMGEGWSAENAKRPAA
jgi:hypothetical protein